MRRMLDAPAGSAHPHEEVTVLSSEIADLGSLSEALAPEQLVTLFDELEFSRAYLELEQLRFDRRLVVSWQTDERAFDHGVPAFVMQPLIENAIKHAVNPSEQPVTLTISAGLDQSDLLLSVTDDGRFGPAADGPGSGLANLMERLQLRYDGKAALSTEVLARGFRAELRLPLANR